MRTKAFYIPMILLLNDVMISIPQPGMLILQPDLTFESLRVMGFSLAGTVRLVGIPLSLLVILDSLKKRRIKKAVVSLMLPIISLLAIFLIQFFAIPAGAISTHATGIIRYLSWGFGYLALLSTLNEKNSIQVRNIIIRTLLILFILLIIQYPSIILNSGYSVAMALQLYGKNIIKMNGIFAAANEDGNGAIALLPFFLAYMKIQSRFPDWALRLIAFGVTPFMIFFNGTRTALFVTYPIVLSLFYSKFSLRSLIKSSVLFSFLGLLVPFILPLIQSAFSEEAEGGGTFGWRVEKVWVPSFNYALETSPILGFGTRGWEFAGYQAGIINIDTGTPESAHNVYLWAFVSWGLVGFLIYVLLLLTLLVTSFRLVNFPDKVISTYAKASFCSVIAYIIWAFISNANIDIAWLILILIASLIASLSIQASSIRASNFICSVPV